MGEFKARAGALTLLFMTSAQGRPTLLQILADAMVEEADRLLDLDALPDPYSDEEDPEYALVGAAGFEEDEEDDDDDEASEEPPPSFELDPDQPMRATPAGSEALFVASTLEDWLRGSPHGPLQIGEAGAGLALASLVCGWGTGVVHALAGEPLTLPAVNAAVPDVPYRAIEEQIDGMEHSGLVEAVTDADGGTRYAATDWLREGIAPLAAAARLEGHHPAEDVSPPEGLDAEAAFRLALPLLELPGGISGSCRLSASLGGGDRAGVTAWVEDGRLASCATELEPDADAWASASAVDWLDTLVEPTAARVETGGDENLAVSLLAGLHERLFMPVGG